MEHSNIGKIRVVGPPVTYSYANNTVRLPPPMLGEHTIEILRDLLKYPDNEIQNLISQKIIQ